MPFSKNIFCGLKFESIIQTYHPKLSSKLFYNPNLSSIIDRKNNAIDFYIEYTLSKKISLSFQNMKLPKNKKFQMMFFCVLKEVSETETTEQQTRNQQKENANKSVSCMLITFSHPEKTKNWKLQNEKIENFKTVFQEVFDKNFLK